MLQPQRWGTKITWESTYTEPHGSEGNARYRRSASWRPAIVWILDEARQVFAEIGDHEGLADVEAGMMFTKSWADGQMVPHRADLERLADMYEAPGQQINTAHAILGIAAWEVIDGHHEEAAEAGSRLTVDSRGIG